MGRYALNQIAALREHRPEVEMTVLLRPDGNEGFQRLAPGGSAVTIPESLCLRGPDPGARATRLARDADYSAWIAGLGLDVLLAPTPFVLGLEPFLPLPGVVPTVLDVYDLIPLVFRSQYLVRGSPFEAEYLRVL